MKYIPGRNDRLTFGIVGVIYVFVILFGYAVLKGVI